MLLLLELVGLFISYVLLGIGWAGRRVYAARRSAAITRLQRETITLQYEYDARTCQAEQLIVARARREKYGDGPEKSQITTKLYWITEVITKEVQRDPAEAVAAFQKDPKEQRQALKPAVVAAVLWPGWAVGSGARKTYQGACWLITAKPRLSDVESTLKREELKRRIAELEAENRALSGVTGDPKER